jgi:hypothetical protein
LQLFPRKKIIQENQGNELTRSNSPSPILGQEEETREAEEEEQNKGWTPYTKTYYKEERGIFEIRCVEWTKEAVFGFKRSRKSKLSGSESKTGCNSNLVSENSLGIRFAEKSTSDEREKRNTKTQREKRRRERRKRAVGSVEGTRLLLRGHG